MKHLDQWISRFQFCHAVCLMRICIGILYLWFGVLKFFPTMSPAEDLAINTTVVLTFGLIPNKICIILLASWESLIGLAFLSGKYIRPAFYLLFVHMICTFAPLVIFPLESFKIAPIVFTIEGQYIMKNLVLLSGGILIYAHYLQNQATKGTSTTTSISKAKKN